MSCDFCTITEAPQTHILYEDEATAAFFPHYPATPGHTLLIPRAHITDIYGLDRHAAESLARSTLVLAKAIRAALLPEGLNVITSSGTAASQSVFHLHIHLVPRWTNDRIGNIWPPKQDLNVNIEDDLADRIRREIDNTTA
ncbi:HIT family protein [Nonomuraea bangladeshensis]|uniref:HIT family protein n=1 Tax=Nonomuraea bangladeshensis TaxID=404385 RepID=A0ABV3HEY2_9ACTN